MTKIHQGAECHTVMEQPDGLLSDLSNSIACMPTNISVFQTLDRSLGFYLTGTVQAVKCCRGFVRLGNA